VPQTQMLDGLDYAVASAFARACTVLSRAGVRLVDLPLRELGELPALNAEGGFSAAEAYRWAAPPARAAPRRVRSQGRRPDHARSRDERRALSRDRRAAGRAHRRRRARD